MRSSPGRPPEIRQGQTGADFGIRRRTGQRNSADLIGNDRFVLAFLEFHQIEYLHGKVNRKCTQFAFSHKKFSFCKVIYHRKRKNQGGLPPSKRSAVNDNTILTPAGRKLHGQRKLTSSQATKGSDFTSKA